MDLPNWLSLERVGRPDFRAATGQLVLGDFIRHIRNLFLPTGRATQTPNYDARLISGFSWTTALVGAGTVRTLNRGSGLFPYLDLNDNTVKHAILLADEGLESIQVDFASATDAVAQAVYVRFVLSAANFANRVFWNPSGAPAQEYVDNIATRLTPAWEVIFQDAAAASPGSEYVKLYEVTKAAGAITVGVDYRHFFFEGSANPTDTYDPEWGDGANDRNSDRALYGINDLHKILQAIRRQLADIIGDPFGDHEWQKVPGIELLSLALEHYSESEAATGTPGQHKTLTVGPLNQTHEMSSIDQDNWGVQMQDQPDNALLQHHADDGAGQSEIIWTPRGPSAELTNLDRFRREVGQGVTADFREELIRNAADDYNYELLLHGQTHVQFVGGSAAAQKASFLEGQVSSGEEYRVSGTQQTEPLQVPLQMLNNQGAGAWGYDEVLPGGAGRLTVASAASGKYTSCEIVLPHNAILVTIRVLWAQGSAGGGVRAGTRLYALRHRIAQNTVGIIGGGTGSPTTITSLNLALDYIEHSLSGGGAATPYRRVEEFTADVATANRTFDMAQDKLVLTLESPDDAGAIACSIYWIMVNYVIDYVSPPLA